METKRRLKAVKRSDRTVAEINRAFAHQKAGDLKAAASIYETILRVNPHNFTALNLFGVLCLQERNYKKAVELLSRATAINATFEQTEIHLATALKGAAQYTEALETVSKVISAHPENVDALICLGNIFQEIRRYKDAIAAFSKALTLGGARVEVLNNLGNTFAAINDATNAQECYEIALLNEPSNTRIIFNLGNLKKQTFDFINAIAQYDKLVMIDPTYRYGIGSLIHCKMYCVDWMNYDALCNSVQKQLKESNPTIQPFQALPIFNDPESQLLIAKLFASQRASHHGNRHKSTSRAPGRIRLGYFSADFHNHATAYLMAQLFEKHDKDKFELYAFSFGPNCLDEMRARISTAFDHFFDVRSFSDQEIADLSRTNDIDIAIDLKGYTQDSRPGIFNYRCAPIQINYLGFPGTMGSDVIDYIIADEVIIPPEDQFFYTEKVI